MNCDRCGIAIETIIRGKHIRSDKIIPFQICSDCDTDVFFHLMDWSDLSSAARKARSSGRSGRPKKFASDKERYAFHNARRREKKLAAK